MESRVFHFFSQTMTKISDLPPDLVEDLLSKVPGKSQRKIRTTCKKWNSLCKNRKFTEMQIAAKKTKNQAKEFQMIVMLEYKLHLMSVNLQNKPSINPKGKLVSLNIAERLKISSFRNCSGVLLCLATIFKYPPPVPNPPKRRRLKNNRAYRTPNNSSVVEEKEMLVAWNPSTGETKLIEPRNAFHENETYTLGYNQSEEYQILRVDQGLFKFEIFSFKASSWKVLDLRVELRLVFGQRCVSLKGNTYWCFGYRVGGEFDYFICFDFTSESFGPPLFLPFHSSPHDHLLLSNVGEEQIAVLLESWDMNRLEIWVTSKIEPNEVSWNKLFLAVERLPLNQLSQSFFLDYKGKVVVIFDKDDDGMDYAAHVIGENGYLGLLELGGSSEDDCYPVACSYVPSSVQINFPLPELSPCLE